MWSLPQPLRPTDTGVDQIPGHDGKRFAVSVGPVVLACVALPGHKMTKLDGWGSLTTLLPISPTAEVSTWLTQDSAHTAGFRRSYSITGVVGFKFIPMWEIGAAQEFTTYPVFAQ